MAITPSSPNPSYFGNSTGSQSASGFVRVTFTGLEKTLAAFDKIADSVDFAEKRKVVEKASQSILFGYREKARAIEATGNLAKSTKTIVRRYRKGEVAVAITGPEQTGAQGATNKRASGNHAWLVEFGSKPRRPGTQNRRTYINIHQRINGKMSRHSSTNDADFENRSRGYYFLMGSINEPTRQARMGRGYTHDFMRRPGEKMRPMTLHPGETYGGMPGLHIMERTIGQAASQVRSTLESQLNQLINRAMSGG